MREEFLRKIYNNIEETGMILADDVVLAGVSGGADSMCLLAVLMEYRRRVDFVLRVVHVEHGIRGAASVEDAAFVERFCAQRKVSCEVVRVDAAGAAKEKGISVEEAARELRYAAFEACAERVKKELGVCAARAERESEAYAGCVKTVKRVADGLEFCEDSEETNGWMPDKACGGIRIAVAHHMEDQAETVLWQMIRGSDLRGLGGMRPVRGRIIRPLLIAERGEIEDYLKSEGILWREDCTNAVADYTRNRIRLEVLPVLTALNAQAVSHLFESAGRLRETEDFLQVQTDNVYGRYVHAEKDGGFLLENALLNIHPLLVRRVVYAALRDFLGSAKDIGEVHVRLVVELFSRQVGRILHLPYGGKAARVYDGVALFKRERDVRERYYLSGRSGEQGTSFSQGECEKQESFEGNVEQQKSFFPEERRKQENGVSTRKQRTTHISRGQVRMEVLETFDFTEIPKNKYTKWFDYDKIKDNVLIRRRQSGDYLVVDGEGHRQKLKRYFINAKIPERERDEVLLAADGSHIMWVIGYRISDYYKIDEHTKRVLQVCYCPESEN